MALNTTQELIEDIRQGRMVVLMDDEDRENEGDLIMAAECVTADDINFMARYGRGLICLTLTRARCEQLQLPLMVSGTDAKHLTNFTVSIEAASGVTTGISAADRATTVQAAVAANAGPRDIVQPGHIFPLMAQSGGVLARAGHTEAGSDLARLAGKIPASVIVEILNDDGTMARRPQLEKFAAAHRLKIGTIADLIQYRIEHESTIERVAECPLPTSWGEFRLLAYHDLSDHQMHFALTLGDIDPARATLVRVHVEDQLGDVLHADLGNSPLPLRKAMQTVAAAGHGVIVVLRKPDDHRALIQRMMDLQLRQQGVVLPRPDVSQGLRSYGVGAQILVDLGVRRLIVLGAPKKLHGLSGFGLEIVDHQSYE